jgi:flagellar FliJ protein
MPRFIFQLEGVLRQRMLAEDQRQRELAAVRTEYVALEEQLRAMDQEVKQSGADLRDNHLVGRLDLAFLAAHRRYSLAMQRKAIALAEKMAAAGQKVEQAQRALAEAAKQRKIIEKLREKRQAEWKLDQARKEMAVTDEVAARIGYLRMIEQAGQTAE